jgi:hypothetical protein
MEIFLFSTLLSLFILRAFRKYWSTKLNRQYKVLPVSHFYQCHLYYLVSAYQGLEELNALEALEESMINNGVLQHQNSVEDSDFLPTDKRFV